MSLIAKLPIARNSKVGVIGDSITFFGWYYHLIGLSRFATDIGRSPSRGGYYRTSEPPLDIVWINSGQSGDRISNIEANVAGRITAYQLQAIILAIGVNDLRFGTSLGTFSTLFNSTVDQARAAQPGLNIAATGIFCNGEDIPNATESGLLALNAIQAATMDRVNGTWTDVHSKVVEWEAENNPSHLPGGLLTDEGFHPSDLGKFKFSEWVNPYIQYI